MAKSRDNDEDIEFDFSPITKYFKRGKKPEADKPAPKPSAKHEPENGRPAKAHPEKKPSEKKTKAAEKDDEEISFDFSKVKNFLKGGPQDEKNSDDEIEFSLGLKSSAAQAGNFFKTYGILLLILIPIIAGSYLRLQTDSLPVTDQIATDNVVGNIKANIRLEVDAQYPNLPDQNKNALVNEEFSRVSQSAKSQIDSQIGQTSAYLKSQFKDDNGLTYLITIDPYYWIRHARNVVDNGHPGDELREGRPYDTHMLAPIGRFVPEDMLYAYVLGYSYKAASAFSNIPLERVVFFMPVIIAALSLIPAFFIARKFAGNVGGFFAALLLAVHQAFLSRSMAGISDTDSFNIFFPLMITWLFLEAFEAESTLKRVLLAVLAGLFTGLYSKGWVGWWYIFDFILATVIFAFLYQMASSYYHARRKNTKASLAIPGETYWIIAIGGIFFASALIFTLLFSSYNAFSSFYTGPAGFLAIKEVAGDTIWPNVFTTVAEQSGSSLPQVIASLGGNFLFLVSVLGILLTAIRKDSQDTKSEFWFFVISLVWLILIALVFKNSLYYFIAGLILPFLAKIVMAFRKDYDVDFKFAIIMIIWFMATLFASVKGVRFILLLVPAFAIGFGIFTGVMYTRISGWLAGELKTSSFWSKPIIFALLMLMIIAPINSGYTLARQRTSDMNDAWYAALQSIDQKAGGNAIINSWWDFGHWFKYIGNRPVTFDGTSQSYTPVHWIGRTLVTGDENEAAGILRMLDCGNYKGTAELNSYLNDDLKTVQVMKKIIGMDRQSAKAELDKNGLDDAQAENVLQFTHCTPPEDYFITSEDMVGKSKVWAHFGLWDFKKAAMYNDVKAMPGETAINTLQEKYGLDAGTADQYYYEIQTTEPNDWISEWPTYYSSATPCIEQEQNTLLCQGGLTVNLTDFTASASPQAGFKVKSIAYALQTGVYTKIIDNAGTISAAIIPRDDGYESVLMDPALIDSMFTRLFFFRGHGLKYFDQFEYQRTVFGEEVYVWRVDWEGRDRNVMQEFAPKTAGRAQESGNITESSNN